MDKEKAKEILIEQLIKTGIKTQNDLSKLKRKISKQFQIAPLSNVSLLKTYHKLLQNRRIKRSSVLENLLKTRPIRSLSGIVNVSVLTKPWPCPGQCIFCPIEKGFPKSYLAGEPAADRAIALNFDPYLQTQTRIQMLRAQGHPTDKIELRIVGGTWSYYPKQYQTWFITQCFAACNAEPRRLKRRTTLKTEQRLNEGAKNRIVGLSIETRPGFVTEKEILRLRKLGVTLVELGVQTVFDDVLKKCQTGLTAEKIAGATKLLKDTGFKVLYQMMPNLPGSTLKKDLETFKILFEDERFKPDWLKIYPCLVCRNTLLYQWWKRGKYKTYSDEELIGLLTKIKQILPYWVRITRIFRDIPAQKIMAGCKTSNLREIIQKEMTRKNLTCHCIRCREVGTRYKAKEKISLFRQDYNASEGKEVFLSFENAKRTKLFSFLRLRKPSPECFIPILQDAAIIREIQTFGPQLPISKTVQGQTLNSFPQHKGLGKKLIKQAEKITKKEFGLSKIAVISGVGARKYYRKLNYRLKDTYMIKSLE